VFTILFTYDKIVRGEAFVKRGKKKKSLKDFFESSESFVAQVIPSSKFKSQIRGNNLFCALYAHHGLDAVFPLNNAVPAVASIKGTNLNIRLCGRKNFTATNGFRIMWTIERQNLVESVYLSEPD